MKPIKLFFGLLIVLLGIFFLLVNLGRLDNDVWKDLLPFWPMILIVVGFLLVFKNNALRILVILVALIFTFWAVAYKPFSWQEERQQREDEEERLSLVEEIGDEQSKTLKLSLDLGGAVININTLGDSENNLLFKADYSKDINLQKNRNSDENYVNATLKENDIDDSSVLNGLNFDRTLNLNLSPNIPVELTINTGGSKLNLDLSNANLSNLVVNAGACLTEIRLGAKSQSVNTEINSGACAHNIFIPKGYGIKVNSGSSLISKDFADLNLKQDGDVYFSENFEQASSKMTVNIKSGVSSLKIEEY